MHQMLRLPAFLTTALVIGALAQSPTFKGGYFKATDNTTQIGLEFEFQRHLGASLRPIVAISAISLVLPFAMGYLAAPWFHARLSEPVPLFGFQLFFAVAMSITAIPVLGRILMELGLSHTRTAALTIGAAAIVSMSVSSSYESWTRRRIDWTSSKNSSGSMSSSRARSTSE